ncbi:MAG: chalcone isomerase family protein [Wenzhouxiangella sp.]|nr:chalcone isomerase family protein [Wenzhouxiangella sp.]
MKHAVAGSIVGALLLANFCDVAQAAPERSELTRCAELELRVAGLFSVGTAYLYLDQCAQAENILGAVPKQFSLTLDRDFKGKDLIESARSILTRNMGLDEPDELPESLQCLASAYVDADSGDRYDVVYRPNMGLELYLNQQLIKRCEDGEDAEKYFMIWFGHDPFHRRMRDRLLEQAVAKAS